MEEGLLEHLETHQGNLDEWCDPDWITHFFGNERDEDEDFCRGALQFFPTWFDKIDFEVINPHDRSTRAGTHPIYYEVVPADTRGTLSLLYAPFPGQADLDSVKLLNAIEKLLTVYGFSAKRTAGWGIATVDGWTIKFKDLASVSGDCAVIKTALDEWRQSLKDKK
jgi:CRISPR-associated protein Cmr2